MEPPLRSAAGVRVGALSVPLQQLQTVLDVLNAHGWRKPAMKVQRYAPGRGAIFLTSAGARYLDSVTEIVCDESNDDHDDDDLRLDAIDTMHAARGLNVSFVATAPKRGGDSEAATPPLTQDADDVVALLTRNAAIKWVTDWRHGSVVPPAVPRAGPSAATISPAAPRFRFIELFAGIGGFRVALEALGGAAVFASEICPHARQTYAANFGEQLPSGDITAIDASDVPPHEILTAGFPCQPFSRAGAQCGLEEPRGELFYEIIRVAQAQRPAAIILENVPNLLRVGEGHALHRIVNALRSCGYSTRINVLNARAYGVPQNRERLFLCAFRDRDAAERFRWPVPSSRSGASGDGGAAMPAWRKMTSTLRDILEGSPGDDELSSELKPYQLSAEQWALLRNSRGFLAHPRLADIDGVARTLRGSYRKSWTRLSEFVATRRHEKSAAGDGESMGVVPPLPLDDAPPPRFYTERECARIQGFPDTFILRGGKQYTQLGNAVSPPMVAAIANEVVRVIEASAKETVAEAEMETEMETEMATATSRRCDGDCLTVAAINLLRGIVAPLDDGADASSSAARGRYGDESAARRRERVHERDGSTLWCMRCSVAYSAN